MRVIFILVILLGCTGCNFDISLPTPTDSVDPLEGVPTSAPINAPYEDVGTLFAGLCFNYLDTLTGKTIRIDSSAALNALYNGVDESRLCPESVVRGGFDFANRTIVGVVAEGTGCVLNLTYVETTQDENGMLITLRQEIVGDCPYELLRPVWFAVERPANDPVIAVQLVD
jgi:hypothetical protein